MSRTNRRSSAARRQTTRLRLKEVKQTIRELNEHTVDRRTTLGKALIRWRTDLILDLGGRDAVSIQELAIIEVCVNTKLLLDSVDAWLLDQPRLVNARKRSLLPAVLQRQQLADALARHLALLGLERRDPPEEEQVTVISDESSEDYCAKLRALRNTPGPHKVTIFGNTAEYVAKLRELRAKEMAAATPTAREAVGCTKVEQEEDGPEK